MFVYHKISGCLVKVFDSLTISGCWAKAWTMPYGAGEVPSSWHQHSVLPG